MPPTMRDTPPIVQREYTVQKIQVVEEPKQTPIPSTAPIVRSEHSDTTQDRKMVEVVKDTDSKESAKVSRDSSSEIAKKLETAITPPPRRFEAGSMIARCTNEFNSAMKHLNLPTDKRNDLEAKFKAKIRTIIKNDSDHVESKVNKLVELTIAFKNLSIIPKGFKKQELIHCLECLCGISVEGLTETVAAKKINDLAMEERIKRSEEEYHLQWQAMQRVEVDDHYEYGRARATM